MAANRELALSNLQKNMAKQHENKANLAKNFKLSEILNINFEIGGVRIPIPFLPTEDYYERT